MMTQTPDRTDVILDDTEWGKQGSQQIQTMFYEASRWLGEQGVTQIVMACNTAHYFEQALYDGYGAPSLVGFKSCLASSVHSLDHLVVLSTSGTLQIGIYKDVMDSVVFPELNGAIQAKVMSAIYDFVKPQGVTSEPIDLLVEVLVSYIQQGYRCFGLCCTELPLIVNHDDFESVFQRGMSALGVDRDEIRFFCPMELVASAVVDSVFGLNDPYSASA